LVDEKSFVAEKNLVEAKRPDEEKRADEEYGSLIDKTADLVIESVD
jgi:hypothetical protein